jgi:hypothetical protein
LAVGRIAVAKVKEKNGQQSVHYTVAEP